MSQEACTWAWRQRLSDPMATLVLVALADYANPDTAEAYPKVTTLAEKTGAHKDTVSAKLAKLAELGLIEVTVRALPGGGRKSNLYHLKLAVETVLPNAGQTVAPERRTKPPSLVVLRTTSKQASTEPSTCMEPAVAKNRDGVWDTLEELFGKATPRTPAHGKRNSAVRDLKLMGASPDSVRAAARAWEKLFDGATLTDVALSKHYPQLSTVVAVAALGSALPAAALEDFTR